MENKKTAVIIGAGIGVITTAIFLAKNEYDVNIYEKNSMAGGRCGQLLHEGHRFDLGATMLLMPGVYREVFESLGLNFDESLEIKPLGDLYKLYFDDGEVVHADLIIANADLPYVYRELLPDKRKSRRLDKMKYSCSAMVFHWGLDKKYPQLAHHNVFLNDGFRTGLRVIFKDKSADASPSFYVHAPARTDPSSAPENYDTLSVIIGIGHLDENRKQDWIHYRKISRDAVIGRLKKAGLTDLEEHIKHEICYNPKTWESAYHVSKGSVFGSLSHSLFQMGYFRPHNRHRKYKNLYFVGGSTHPGNGIPLVLLSAKLTAERILKEEKI